MNQYLFLYPVRGYFRARIENSLFELEGHNVGKLFDIINARYRNDFNVNWLLFSQEKDLAYPDFSLVPDYADIGEQDRVLDVGISFKDHLDGVYADSDFVLNQLPKHERLVLGGFHQRDCVNKMAKRSYERGTDTFVDEDTTDLFFRREPLDSIPLIRSNWSLTALGIPDWLYGGAVEIRRDKPWFVQS